MKTVRLWSLCVVVLALVVVTPSAFSQGLQASELARLLPPEANLVVDIDIAAIRDSVFFDRFRGEISRQLEEYELPSNFDPPETSTGW